MSSYNKKRTFRELVSNYKHAWVFLYVLIYAPWFLYLEHTVTENTNFTIMHCKLDDMIPFCEVFVIPYTIWFAFVAAFIILFFFISKDEFYKLTSYMFIGMTICLIIYTIFPNGHDLRLTEFPRDNYFTDMVNHYYISDTCTNVLPSIHSFNSIVILIAVIKSNSLRKFRYYKPLCVVTTVTALLIMASTVLIKQHSILDMFAAIILAAIMYPFVYVWSFSSKEEPVQNTQAIGAD